MIEIEERIVAALANEIEPVGPDEKVCPTRVIWRHGGIVCTRLLPTKERAAAFAAGKKDARIASLDEPVPDENRQHLKRFRMHVARSSRRRTK